MANEHFTTHLNDHPCGFGGRAGAFGVPGIESAENKAFLAELRADIESDREELQALMRRLGVAR
jgi:hypothetical protein